MKKILLLGDIHANYPALKAIEKYIKPDRFDHIINTGDFDLITLSIQEISPFTVRFPMKRSNGFVREKKPYAYSVIPIGGC
jgi:Icc-related predicted phosphoesterase